MNYTVIIEESEDGWGAYAPDLPGCMASAASREEVVTLIREAIKFHLEGLREQGEPIPEPHCQSEIIQVDAA
ncbi:MULTISPECIES: type II toxin-antitoxin system HicB family antitoxin [unclassified Thioalkalivibrio]|uniref:type II toxin-antitoxin system HicB family antitoxin n=1 Tax=unclassified Thioalkalivibrio TaxID=2621013 RepID=UPI0003776DE9|nr:MULTISPECIES: type II toxin-antitoxin system HicB family antitoxin [unclassified Thioalkalivibrio]